MSGVQTLPVGDLSLIPANLGLVLEHRAGNRPPSKACTPGCSDWLGPGFQASSSQINRNITPGPRD